jgi:putative Holliday junction resolvase
MPILKFDDFAVLKDKNKPILCIDYGTKRIGLAKSDAGWMIASPYDVIRNNKFTQVASIIEKIIKDNHIIGLVIGLPYGMQGEENKKCQSIRQFGQNIIKLIDIPVYFQDERFTTLQAEETLTNFKVSRDKKNERVDKIAASYILQAFLEKVR